jgi:hypothetical protein
MAEESAVELNLGLPEAKADASSEAGEAPSTNALKDLAYRTAANADAVGTEQASVKAAAAGLSLASEAGEGAVKATTTSKTAELAARTLGNAAAMAPTGEPGIVAAAAGLSLATEAGQKVKESKAGQGIADVAKRAWGRMTNPLGKRS